MATINAILKYDRSKKKFDRRNVFGISGIWMSQCAEDVFYGTVAVLTDSMAVSGALPGLTALCPTVVPIRGNWLFRNIVSRLAGSDSDIKVTLFLDESNYRSVLDCDGIDGLYIAVEGKRDECLSDLPEFRLWKAGEDIDEFANGMNFVHMEKRQEGLSDVSIDDEIRRMELEMNDPTEEELMPESRKELDRMISTILDAWEVFRKYDSNMIKFMRNTDPATYDGAIDMSLGPDAGADIEGLPADFREQMFGDGDEGDADLDTAMRLIKMLSNTVYSLSDAMSKMNGVMFEDLKQSKALFDSMKTLDGAMTEAIRSMEERCDAVRDSLNERISGMRNQVALLARRDRAKNYIPVICSAISVIALILVLILK